MRPVRMLLRAAALAALAGLLGMGMVWAQSEGPSLGELARKKKKDDKKTTHVYSDENLPKAGADFGGTSTVGSSGAPAASGGSSDAPAAEGAATTAPAAGGEAKAGESSADLAAAQEKLETARKDEESIKNNIKKLEGQLASETSEFRRETYRQALENSQASLAEYARRREEAEKDAAAAEAAGKKKKKKPATSEETPPQ
ncbi:MAG: hypothetical protein L0099_13340 [Acidobacteria bacterium]|nr:hypothetical protein [Acidobacteriota bacterium]